MKDITTLRESGSYRLKLVNKCSLKEQTIVLMWHPNTETDLAGYKVYMNPDIKDSSFREIKDIPIGSIISVDTVFYHENIESWAFG